jgi:transposase
LAAGGTEPARLQCRHKEFRGIATRYDKTDTSYRANLNLVATVIALR